jgi:hypothetical protein
MYIIRMCIYNKDKKKKKKKKKKMAGSKTYVQNILHALIYFGFWVI